MLLRTEKSQEVSSLLFKHVHTLVDISTCIRSACQCHQTYTRSCSCYPFFTALNRFHANIIRCEFLHNLCFHFNQILYKALTFCIGDKSWMWAYYFMIGLQTDALLKLTACILWWYPNKPLGGQEREPDSTKLGPNMTRWSLDVTLLNR